MVRIAYASNSAGEAILSPVTTDELKRILACVDTAIEIFQRHDGKLLASEISVKSMLLALRSQLTEQAGTPDSQHPFMAAARSLRLL